MFDEGSIQTQYMTSPIIGYNLVHDTSFFVDPDNGDFHLKEGSPAIDAGIDVGFDFSGDAPDIGAFESPYTASTENIYYISN